MVHLFAPPQWRGVAFPSQELEEVLGKTLGVPLFQEQAMRIAIVARALPRPTACAALWRPFANRHYEFGLRLVDGWWRVAMTRFCLLQTNWFCEYGRKPRASFALLVMSRLGSTCFTRRFLCCPHQQQP